MANDVILNVGADTDSAEKSLKQFQSSATKIFTSIAAAFTTVLATEKVFGFFADAAKAAAREEDAINDLNVALSITGKYTTSVSKDLQNFAKQLENSSNFSNEQILKAEALIQSLGKLDKEGLKRATQGAVNLAAVFNKDLSEAAQIVAKASEGETGALSRLGIRIKETGDKAETFNNVLRELDRFAGAAEAKVNTFAGSLVQLNNKQEDVLKSIGRLFTENPQIVKFITDLGKAFDAVGNNIDENKAPITVLITQIGVFADQAIPLLLKGVALAVDAFDLFQRAIGFITGAIDQVLFTIQQRVTKLVDSFSLLKAALKADSLLEAVDAIKEFGKAVADAAIGDVQLSSASKAVKKDVDERTKGLRALSDALNKSAAASQKLANAPAGPITGAAAKLPSPAQVLGPSFSETVFNAFKNAFNQKGLSEGLGAAINAAFTFLDTTEVGKKFQAAFGLGLGPVVKELVFGIGSAISSAASGIKSLLSGEAIGGLASLISGIGSIPRALDTAFQQLGDTVDQLLNGLPDAIRDVLKTIPQVVQKFVDAFPKIVDTLVKALPQIVGALADALGPIFDTIFQALPGLIDALPGIVDKLLKELPKILDSFLKNLPDIIFSLLKALPEIFKSVVAAIPDIIIVIANNLAPIIEALIEGLIEAMPTIIESLILFVIEGMPRIVGALIANIPNIVVAILQGLARGIAGALGAAFGKLAGNFSSGIKLPKLSISSDALARFREIMSGKIFLDKLKDILSLGIKIGGGGGGGGFLKKGKDKVNSALGTKFASGGLVPHGFPNDTFPARLTSGEFVIPKDDVQRLLKGGNGGGAQNITINLQVGEQELASVLLNLNRQGFRVA